MKTVREPAREIPIVAEAEVIVAGGGPGGMMAALAAARGGAKTLLIEKYGFLGGMATAGLMNGFNGFRNERPPNHFQTVRGFAQELVDRLLAAGGAGPYTAHGNFEELKPGECPYAVAVDPEILKRVALEMLLEAGVELRFHTFLSDVIAEGRNVSAVIVESKSGRQALSGKLYIDATGDGDLAARAGARYEQVAKVGERMMETTLMYRIIGRPQPTRRDESNLWINGVGTIWGPYVYEVDGTDVNDLTRAEIDARRGVEKHLRKLQETWPEAKLVQTALHVGIRETRRIVGLYTITEEDVLTGRAQPDAISVSSNPVVCYYNNERRYLEHLGFEVPYRSLVPADLDNVILAGRCISACQQAFQSARSMAPNMALSQASGTAAAMCVAENCRPAELDVAALQRRLQQDGAVTCIPREEG